MKDIVIIAGKQYPLEIIGGSMLRKVWVEARAAFRFYSINFKGVDLILLETKSSVRFTPRKLKLMAERLNGVMGKPAVFLFENLSYVERNRLIEQDVYFIVSGKYAYLPNLLLSVRETEPMGAERLSAVAQWLLLAYLQGMEIHHKTAQELEQIAPFRYVTLTRAFRLLEGLGLCQIATDENRFRHISFDADKRALFEQAKEYFIPPAKQRMYCDKVVSPQRYKKSGINALSHYSSLNPEDMTTLALTVGQWKNRKVDDFVNVNPIEGDYCVEIWHYPPVPTDERYVDRLSLALSLADDHDPRVEKEVELMIEKIW